MPLSTQAQDLLNAALTQAHDEGYTLWGFIVDKPQDELVRFQTGDGDFDSFISNTVLALKLLMVNSDAAATIETEGTGIKLHEA